MVTASILVFPDSRKEFHVKVDAFSIELGKFLGQLGEGELDHPISFSSRNLSSVEKNCTTRERERLAMVYDLQKFRHYFLGYHFKIFTHHYALRYLVNK
jgi:hypothetical protein